MKKPLYQAAIGLKGRYKIEVLNHDGSVAQSRDWRPNLLLDRGLDRLAQKSVAELFSCAAKGTGTTATKETNAITGTLTGVALARTAGRVFDITDEGRLIRASNGQEAIIESFVDANNVQVQAVGADGVLANFTGLQMTVYHTEVTALDAESGRTDTYSAIASENGTTDGTGVNKHKRTLKRTFIFDPEAANLEVVTGTYTWNNEAAAPGDKVNRTAGARNFTAADVGKYIKFSATEYAIITTIHSTTRVTVDRIGNTGGSIELYGFQTYGEVGFDDDAGGTDVNIRCRLEDGAGASDPVVIMGENPETPGQQLKITYEITVAVEPSAATGLASSNIADDSNAMSVNKNGTSVCERLYLSRIDTDGQTDHSAITLEPSFPGYIGLSPSSAALAALAGPDRSDGATYADSEALGDYVDGSFERFFQGTFGINEAIATNWRTTGLFDPDSESFAFTWLFQANQKKDGEHTLTLRFRKSWNRDLS